MITDPAFLRAFEHEQIRTTPADYARNLAIVEALCQEARLLASRRLAGGDRRRPARGESLE